MEGITLFVDDEVFNASFENKLFKELSRDKKNPILPINNLDDFEKTIKSISTFNAIILDWEFSESFEGVPVTQLPIDILLENNLYCLIFIYSHSVISSMNKNLLKEKYGDKIEFLTKISNEDEIVKEKQKVLNAIIEFKGKNPHLVIPYIWSQAMNQSAQTIFSELENADPNWINEVYETSKSDGGDPNLEIINVFQNLLSESIIQDEILLRSLSEYTNIKVEYQERHKETLAKLYNRIYYTKLSKSSPIMTGDIFCFNEDEFAILITPECDVCKKKESTLEFLCFTKSGSNKYINSRIKKDGESLFNNKSQSNHVLPSFPFEKDVFNLSAYINFELAYSVKDKTYFENKRSEFKLNAPYIYQLRQRYLAYIGRVGVPAIPLSLKTYNLNKGV